jgi:hypothetical protein
LLRTSSESELSLKDDIHQHKELVQSHQSKKLFQLYHMNPFLKMIQLHPKDLAMLLPQQLQLNHPRKLSQLLPLRLLQPFNCKYM